MTEIACQNITFKMLECFLKNMLGLLCFSNICVSCLLVWYLHTHLQNSSLDNTFCNTHLNICEIFPGQNNVDITRGLREDLKEVKVPLNFISLSLFKISTKISCCDISFIRSVFSEVEQCDFLSWTLSYCL